MRPEDVEEKDRYYRHGGQDTAHIVFDTFSKESPPGSTWEYTHITTFCKGIFNYGKNHRENIWGSKEDVLTEGVSLCEACEKAFEEAKEKGILDPTKPGYSMVKGMELLRDILKDKK